MDAYFRNRGILLDRESCQRLRKETSRAMAEARHQVGKYTVGDHGTEENAKRFPPLAPTPKAMGSGPDHLQNETLGADQRFKHGPLLRRSSLSRRRFGSFFRNN